MGAGITSSSDGQFFRAGDRAAARSDVNLHYGSEPGAKFYSHLSDQYGYFSILPISPTESEAPYVLDGLFDHETRLDIAEHFTDTGGSSDHVFALFALLGKRFSPRLRDLKLKQFHTFDGPDAYPALRKHIGLTLRPELMREHWSEILHMAASMNDRVVAPSTMLKKLSASQKPSLLSKALSEVGRLERTLFMIEYYSDPGLRRRCQGGLNKGEAAHKLKRAVFFHESGEIRDRVIRQPGFSRLRPQSGRRRNRLLEHRLSGARRRSPQIEGTGDSRQSAETRFAADLGAHQSHRHLFLANRTGQPRCLQADQGRKAPILGGRLKRYRSIRPRVPASSKLGCYIALILS